MNEKINELLIKGGIITISAIMGAITDIAILFTCLFVIVLIDNVLAIYEKLKFGIEKFDYRKLKSTIEKIICYGIVLVLGIILFIVTEIRFYTAFAVYIAIYEGISVLKHLSKITGLELFADIMNYVKEKLSFKNWKK